MRKVTAASELTLKATLIGLCVISASGCSTQPPISSREQARASLATANWLESRYGFVSNPELDQMLLRMTSRLSKGVYGAALGEQLDPATVAKYKNYPWQIYVLNDSDPNAYSLGSGVIVVTKGLIKYTSTESELAAVISHEMAHVLLGHNATALENAKSAQAPVYSFSLDQEIAADRLGLRILNVAHYDLRSALPAFTIAYRQTDRIVSSSESNWRDERAANLEKALAESGEYLPATLTTREFNRVRRSL